MNFCYNLRTCCKSRKLLKEKISDIFRKTLKIYKCFSTKPVKLSFDRFKGKNSGLPPLLIMHGLLGSKRNWRGIAKFLNESMGNKIFNLDARNHGDSPHAPEHTFESMSADVVEFMKRQNIKKAAVMGHSMGGRVMMHMALKYPDLVDRAIFVDISPFDIPRDHTQMETMLLAMESISVPRNTPILEATKIVEKKLQKAVHESDVSFLMRNFTVNKRGHYKWKPNLAVIRNSLKLFDNFKNDIANFQPYPGPVLFIGGEHSYFINPDDWPAIQKIFPNSILTWLDTGHLVHFDEPVQFVNLVIDFMQKSTT